MTDINSRFEKLGVSIPQVLLPKKDIELDKWAVVACDQYTSQPEYWDGVQQMVGEQPSTFHLIFPEIYLEREDMDERIQRINRSMEEYLEKEILAPQSPGFVYVERQVCGDRVRRGLMVALDLDRYEYTRGSGALIRATEDTVVKRLPPRIKIRQNALLELPHILVLVDDPEKTVIEPLTANKEKPEKIYETRLMMNGGNICGYLVTDDGMLTGIMAAIEKLSGPENFCRKYSLPGGTAPMLFAVGDGNHSLASAKAHWQNVRESIPPEERKNHPARFALVELVNVHDEGLEFEPIHRVLFSVNPGDVLSNMLSFMNESFGVRCRLLPRRCGESTLQTASVGEGCQIIPYVYGENDGAVLVENPKHNLEVGTLQCFLDDYLGRNPAASIDYIHGEDVVRSLTQKGDALGFLLPPMNKHDLFKTVILDGALPRKTFSMGEAHEKRFYLECRKIR